MRRAFMIALLALVVCCARSEADGRRDGAKPSPPPPDKVEEIDYLRLQNLRLSADNARLAAERAALSYQAGWRDLAAKYRFDAAADSIDESRRIIRGPRKP